MCCVLGLSGSMLAAETLAIFCSGLKADADLSKKQLQDLAKWVGLCIANYDPDSGSDILLFQKAYRGLAQTLVRMAPAIEQSLQRSVSAGQTVSPALLSYVIPSLLYALYYQSFLAEFSPNPKNAAADTKMLDAIGAKHALLREVLRMFSAYVALQGPMKASSEREIRSILQALQYTNTDENFRAVQRVLNQLHVREIYAAVRAKDRAGVASWTAPKKESWERPSGVYIPPRKGALQHTKFLVSPTQPDSVTVQWLVAGQPALPPPVAVAPVASAQAIPPIAMALESIPFAPTRAFVDAYGALPVSSVIKMVLKAPIPSEARSGLLRWIESGLLSYGQAFGAREKPQLSDLMQFLAVQD